MRTLQLAVSLSMLAAVACTEALGPGTGTVEITVAVGGPDPDPAGFVVTVDGQGTTAIPETGSVTLDLDMGHHTIVLSGGAARCSALGSNSKSVAINPGETTEINFAVGCTALTGAVEVRAATSGHDPDPDGYGVSLDAGPVQLLQANGVVRFAGVSGGTHSLSFSGLAPHCTAAGTNPREVEVSVGGMVRDLAAVAYAVTCTATTGAIRITAPTTGPSPDPAYVVVLNAGAPMYLAAAAILVVDFIAPGSHSIQLTGIASNCELGGSNPATVSVVAGDTSEVAFGVTCTQLPRTGVDVILTTTGTNPDLGYNLAVYDFNNCYYCGAAWFGPVPANGTVPIDLPAGSYSYTLSDVAGNCTGPSEGTFSVSTGQGTTLALVFTCFPTGTVVVGVSTSGVEADLSYYATLDGVWQPHQIAAGGSVSLQAIVGTRAVGLTDVAPNCAVSGPNPVTVTVAPSGTTNVAFSVTCVANPRLQVTVVTTGPNAPATYLVGVDPNFYYGYDYLAVIPSDNGTVSIILPPGTHMAALDQVPLNCTVTSPNNVSVNISMGATTNLAFSVTCT